jgi:hypothetical protein
MIVTEESQILWRKPCVIATIYTKTPTRNGLQVNPGLRDEGPAINLLSHEFLVVTLREHEEFNLSQSVLILLKRNVLTFF